MSVEIDLSQAALPCSSDMPNSRAACRSMTLPASHTASWREKG